MSTVKPKVLDDLIKNHAKNDPEKTAIWFEDRSVSYGEFYDGIDRAARMLLGLGIGRNDRVGLMFPNRPDMLLLYFACFRIGAIAVPVNTHYQRPEIEYSLDHSKCRLLIIDKMFSVITKEIDQNVSSLEHILVYDDDPGQMSDSYKAAISSADHPDPCRAGISGRFLRRFHPL